MIYSVWLATTYAEVVVVVENSDIRMAAGAEAMVVSLVHELVVEAEVAEGEFQERLCE